MRRVCLTLGVSAALVTAFLVTGSDAACAKCGGSGGYYAGACGAPGYGSMSPGCCEHVPSCCDHVWDGYCQERHGGCGLSLCWPTRWWPGGTKCEPSAALPSPTTAPTTAPIPAATTPATAPAPAATTPAIAPMPAPVAPVPGPMDAPQKIEVKPTKEKEANRSDLRLMRLPDVNRVR
jgi:hypothetical protein